MPEVSVLMPVKNGESYIDEAILSITQQTFKDFELLILNDGSSDGTVEVIEKWQDKDCRISAVHTEHQGISKSLNHLISISDSSFLMRMDADDISMPTRIQSQVHALKTDPAVGIVGSKVNLIGSKSGIWHFRQSDEETKALALVGNTCLCHPSWMMNRARVGNLRYTTDFPHMEDMHFLAQYIREPNSKLFALNDMLLNYRIHDNSISGINYQQQIIQRARVLAWTWECFGIVFKNIDPINFIRSFVMPQGKQNKVDKSLIKELITRVVPQLIYINPLIEKQIKFRVESINMKSI